MHAQQLLARYAPISDQVSKDQLAVILGELERALAEADGAVVEFGCYIGTASLFIRRLLDLLDVPHEFHAYDSFAGLPGKTINDESRAGEQFQGGALAVSKRQFLLEFKKAGLRPPLVHKGWFQDLTAAEIPKQIAFAFLDGDFYESIRDSLRLVLPRLQPSGVIVIDDYAREALPGVAVAAHECFALEQIRTSHNLGIIRV